MKWEYKIIKQWMDEYEMNPLGNEGWNLMEVLRPTPDSLPWYIFKRPKEEPQTIDYNSPAFKHQSQIKAKYNFVGKIPPMPYPNCSCGPEDACSDCPHSTKEQPKECLWGFKENGERYELCPKCDVVGRNTIPCPKHDA